MRLAEAFRDQASACGDLGSPMYADLLARVADDLDAGGPSGDVLRGQEDAPGPSAVALRLAGSVHRLVLQRRAGALAAWYPSVGGTWEPDSGWAAFRALLEQQPEDVREWLDRAPQTNEVGRAAALMGGLLHLQRTRGLLPVLPVLPVRLWEIGSSGGLNLLADRFRYLAPGLDVGPADSPVVLDPAWSGWERADPGPAGTAPWPDIVERVGSDLLPVDVATTAGRLALTAYVWADQALRHERLRGALAVARQVSVVVHRRTATEQVDALVLVAGTTTVLWHSVMWQYLGPDEQRHVRARIEHLGAAATADAPFAHLCLEPARRTPQAPHEFPVALRSWPGGERQVLATAAPHGLPVTWE